MEYLGTLEDRDEVAPHAGAVEAARGRGHPLGIRRGSSSAQPPNL